jgi:hypothetical protein
MIPKKILAALEKVVTALAPLDPEARRQVIEATHTLIEIGSGRQGGGEPLPGKALAKGKKR